MKSGVEMIKKAKRRRNHRPAWSDLQTTRYRELVAKFEDLGFVVRREELKRGHCWRVLSGVCRFFSQRVIFVDSRLNPDEQVAFLAAKLVDVELSGSATEQPVTTPA